MRRSILSYSKGLLSTLNPAQAWIKPRCLSSNKFSHLNDAGSVRMVDVGGKGVTARYARAVGRIRLGEKVFKSLTDSLNLTGKGNIIEVAKIGGIMAAKKTSELIPLCHAVPLDHVDISVEAEEDRASLKLTCEVRCESRTGCEMEALVGVSTACLTVYDMCKSMSHEMSIGEVELVEKKGGRSGHFINTSKRK